MSSKKSRKAKRIAKKTADTTAGLVGNVIRVSIKAIMTVLLIFITTGLLFTCIFAYYVKTTLSSEMDVNPEEFSLALSSTIYYEDSNGDYQELTQLISSEKRISVEYENIPLYMEEAAVSIEDKRFYEHKGVDWYRTVAAFGNMFISMKNDFGGSTITQQLIKNMTEEDDVTVQRKLLEIFRALEFEKKYTKEEIMGWYLNEIYLGEGCYGVQAAAQTYFGKDVWDLSLAECASIIGITNNPSRYDPFISRENNKQRQETILFEMYDQEYITYEEYTQAVNEELQFRQGEDGETETTIYSYYEEVVIQEVIADLAEAKGISTKAASQLVHSGGYQIYCSLDMDIQNIVDEVYENRENMPVVTTTTGQELQSAIVIMDPYTGEIVAMSGGVGEKTENYPLNRATQSQRPPGSSFKPIATYGPAMDLGLITQTTTVNDSPNIVLEGTTWYPKNSGGGNSGIVTIRVALQKSLNTVSAQILDKLGVETSVDYLENRLGITSLTDADHDYAPLALGQLTNGITVREMAAAYCAFVNDGIYTAPRTYTLVTDYYGNTILDNQPETTVAFKANTAWNMTDMLKNAVEAGTGTEAYLGIMPAAGKTGTTSDDYDRYFVGFTPYYVAAVWTGFDTPAKMVCSGNPAAQIWKKIMYKVHENLPYKSFPTPTIGSPTNIFGNMVEATEEPTEEPTPSDEVDTSDSPTTSDSPAVTDNTGTSTPNTTTPTADVPVTTDTPVVVVTDPPIVTNPVDPSE